MQQRKTKKKAPGSPWAAGGKRWGTRKHSSFPAVNNVVRLRPGLDREDGPHAPAVDIDRHVHPFGQPLLYDRLPGLAEAGQVVLEPAIVLRFGAHAYFLPSVVPG